MPRLDPETFLKAAELIETKKEIGACVAIDEAAGYSLRRELSSERSSFLETFCPHFTDEAGEFDFHYWLQRLDETPGSPESIHRRVVALCFAAAMAETDDLLPAD